MNKEKTEILIEHVYNTHSRILVHVSVFQETWNGYFAYRHFTFTCILERISKIKRYGFNIISYRWPFAESWIR